MVTVKTTCGAYRYVDSRAGDLVVSAHKTNERIGKMRWIGNFEILNVRVICQNNPKR